MEHKNSKKKFEEYPSWIKRQSGNNLKYDNAGIIKSSSVELHEAEKGEKLNNTTDVNEESNSNGPEVEYVKKGGRVTGVFIKCICGEVIQLDLCYDKINENSQVHKQ